MTKIVNWEKNLKKLKAYHKKYGAFNVPSKWKEDRVLSQWVENIRKKRHQLPKALKEQLDELGFNFDYDILDDWSAMYEKLEAFYKTYGHTEIPKDDPEHELLRRWIDRQRLSQKRLLPHHIKKLNEIEFIWSSLKAYHHTQWLKGFEKLKSYYLKFGTSRIEWKDSRNAELFEWSRTQIKRNKKGELSEDKIRLLNSIEFDWNAGRKKEQEKKWLRQYEDLKKFAATYGHCRVPNRKEFRRIFIWAATNRAKANFLTRDQVEKLNDLGFQWGHDIKAKKEEKWNTMFEKLKQFRKKHGHIRVTRRQDSKLGRWLIAQEERVSLGKDRRQKLGELGMIWIKDRQKAKDTHWNKMYNLLRDFYRKNGHCIVPIKSKELRQWTQNLRAWNKTLTNEQRKKLKAINFDINWKRSDFFKLKWEGRYKELKKFKRKFGHCSPSKHTGDYRSLGLWVASQRKAGNKLSAEQKKKLNALGFDWKVIKKSASNKVSKSRRIPTSKVLQS